jgi:hypothetical protein
MSPILTGVIASGISGHLTPPWSPEGAYDALATITVPSGGAASVTFSGIPTGYKHLQIRALVRDNRSASLNNITLRANSDTSANYTQHALYADGSTVGAFGNASTTLTYGGIIPSASATASVFGGSVIDVLDYTNNSKYKTFRVLSGFDANGLGSMRMYSGLWMSTSAITSLTFDSETSGDFVEYSSFALYGVK